MNKKNGKCFNGKSGRALSQQTGKSTQEHINTTQKTELESVDIDHRITIADLLQFH